MNQTDEEQVEAKGGDNEWMETFDDELFKQSKEKTKLTRKEKRENQLKYNQKDNEAEEPRHMLDMPHQKFKTLPRERYYLNSREGGSQRTPINCWCRIFYRRWIPPGLKMGWK